MSNELELVDDRQGAALPVVQQNNQVRTTGSTPADLVRYAMESGADLDRLERLMQMQVEWEKREAEKAYHAAVAAFKENAPTIRKNKTADFATQKGRTTYDFATLGNVVSMIVPELAKHGLSHRWVPDQNGALIGITCILTHQQGHSESIRLEASKDESGGKNSIQAIGSAKSYLERYTLLAITGLAVEDSEDDDGKSFSKDDLDTSLADEWIAKVKAAPTDQDVIAVWNAGAAKMEDRPHDFKEFQKAVASRRYELNQNKGQ
ncbi:MAG: ERF family protein [Alphaproteobacteria bacterium]|nr:ERF family protein [Alphaproteobacteria bacterium]